MDVEERLKSALADRYTIESQIGEGGMAAVYLAEDRAHQRKVAIKVLSPEVAHAVGAERFLNEIRIAANLTHPNILPLHDSGEADGLLYYVMPYVEGDSLRDRLAREQHLPMEDAIQIVREVADALTHAHGLRLIHRDIKPENILFTSGHAVVADFGIAKALDAAGGNRLTQTGIAVGTPTYMSPEQSAGSDALDGRSDTYSLGCLAYEMLGGEPPFTGPTPQAVLARHAVDPVPELRTIRPNVPEGVAKAIERALAKVPADRFLTVKAFADALSKASTEEAIAAEVAKRERAGGRRRIGVAAVVVMLAVAGFWIANALGGPNYERLAVLPPLNRLNDPDQEHLMQGVHDALISELQQAGVSVKSLSSMMQYRGTVTPPGTIAEELRVDALLEPSVRWGADSVEIEVRLVDGETEDYIADPIMGIEYAQNVFGLYRDLVREVVDDLQLALSPEAEARLSIAKPVNPAAYEDYLNGQFHWNSLTQAGMETALEYFEQALEKEPDFAQAHAGIARVWAGRQQLGFATPSEAGSKAREALALALAGDSALFEVQYSTALVRTWVNWDWQGGEAAFLKTLEINPDFVDARAYYSYLLMVLGRRGECEEQMDRAMELDPLKPLILTLYGHILVYGGHLDEAISFYQDALRTAPDNPVTHNGLLRAFYKKGMHREALEQAGLSYAIQTGEEITGALQNAFEERGPEEAWLLFAEALAGWVGPPHFNPARIAEAFDQAGQAEQALSWLERAFETRDPSLPALTTDRFSEAVRVDPRFKDLQRRMNLPGS